MPEKLADHVRMQAKLAGLILVVLLMVAVGLLVSVAVRAQSPGEFPEDDIWSVDNFSTDVISGVNTSTHLFENFVTLEIVYVVRVDGSEVLRRVATTDEIDFYNLQKANRIAQVAIAGAEANLTGDPEQGENWQNWVDNRSLELADCEQVMMFGQTFDFTDLGVNNQNLTISEMQRCIELNSKVQRKVINNLLDLLIEQGIVTVTQ